VSKRENAWSTIVSYRSVRDMYSASNCHSSIYSSCIIFYITTTLIHIIQTHKNTQTVIHLIHERKAERYIYTRDTYRQIAKPMHNTQLVNYTHI
jgi:hypothetical protein